MEALHFILIILFISQYKAASDILTCNDMTNPDKNSDCYYLPFQMGNYKCCFVKTIYYFDGDFKNTTRCLSIDREYYDHISKITKSHKAYLNSRGGIIESYEVDCPSNYLSFPLLSLIIFLL